MPKASIEELFSSKSLEGSFPSFRGRLNFKGGFCQYASYDIVHV